MSIWVFSLLLGCAFAACPEDNCLMNDAANTLPTVSADLTDGVLTIVAESFAGVSMHIAANEDDITNGLDCAPISVDNPLLDSQDCARTLTYQWDWDTITNPACSGQYETPDDGSYIRRKIRVQVVDHEISGNSLFNPVCVRPHHTFEITFELPTTVTYDDTIMVFSPFREGHALIDNLSHDLDAGDTRGELYLSLSYPFQLASIAVVSGPANIDNGQISLVQSSSSASCDGDVHEECDYVFELSILEQVCDDGVDPYGSYEFTFDIQVRPDIDGPPVFESTHSLTFEIPQLVDCNFQTYTGTATLTPYTVQTDPDTGAPTQTTQFMYQQPVTLIMPIAVDYYTPTAGRLEYIRVCEHATMDDAQNVACDDGTSQKLTYNNQNEDYDATAGFLLQTEQIYDNIFFVQDSNDANNPELRVTFYFDDFLTTGSVENPNDFSFLRFEVEVTHLRFVNDPDDSLAKINQKSDDSIVEDSAIYPNARASTTVFIRHGGSGDVEEPNSEPVVVYKSDYTMVIVVAAAVCVLAVVILSRRSRKSSKATKGSTLEKDCSPLV